MLEMMKDSILGCLWGGFSAHSRSCENGFTPVDRDRSPHERQRDSSPGTVTCSWGQGKKSHKQEQIHESGSYRRIEKSPDVSPPKRRPPPAKRPRYILDLKTDTCYLETDLDYLEKSRSFESSDSGMQNFWNTSRSRSRIIETEADIHHEGSDTTMSPIPVTMAIGPNGEHVQYQPIRGILKKSISYHPQPEDDVRKRDALMNTLSKRYPQYAERITGSEDGYPVRSSRRPRDPQRRATVVTYNPNNDRAVEFDDVGSETMSNVEGPVASFQRGGWLRNSMPIVRSPPNTYDRRMGVVFLVMGSETKKAELPNEITHLDTVRAMFVRSFPGKLSMEYLESPRRKIYILDPVTNIYYQLEDLRDIKDRTVLRLYECDSNDPQKVKDPPPETRGKMVLTPREGTPPRVPTYPPDTPATAITDKVRKAQTLPASMVVSFPPFHENDYEVPKTRSKSAERSRSLPRGHTGPDYGYITYQSPDRSQFPQDRQGTPDRLNLRPIPENIQMQNGHHPSAHYDDLDGRGRPGYHGHPGHQYHQRSVSPPVHRSQLPPGDPMRRTLSPPPGSVSQGYEQFRGPGGVTAPGAPPQTYVAKGVRANTVVSPLRATGPSHDTRNGVSNNRHSLAFTPVTDISPTKPTQRSQSYRVTSDYDETTYAAVHRQRSVTPQPVPNDPETRFRMDKMEEQIASLAAWVQTAVDNTSSRASSVRSTASTTPSDGQGSNTGSVIGKDERERLIVTKGVSDLSSGSSGNTITQNIKDGILTIRQQTADLKLDLRNIRRMNQLNNETLQESIHETMKKIAKALRVVPGAEHQLLRQQRSEIDVKCQRYLENKKKIYKELSDLESAVEELRSDVISRQCRVNMTDVETMALMLSNITKAFGELKVKFPELQKDLKSVMAGEMEVVVKEEKFLKDEPENIEDALKRCKKLTGTLFTLKRLASVQEHRPIQHSKAQVGGRLPSEDDKKALLENIKAMVPNHEARVHSLEAADASRERKKKIVTQQESLKFGKSLEIASKALKSGAKESFPLKEPHSRDNLDLVSKETVVKDIAYIETSPIISSTTIPTSTHSSDAKRTESSDSCESESIVLKADKDAKRKAALLAIKKDAARAAFFSSLTTPPTSPAEEKRVITPPSTTTMDYTVRISPIRVTSSGETQYTVNNSVVSSLSTSPSAFTTTKPTFLPVSSKRSSGTKSASPTPSPPTPHYQIGSVEAGRKPSPSSIPRFSTPKVSVVSVDSDKSSKKIRTSTPITSNDKTSSTVTSKPVVRSKPETAKGVDVKKIADSASIFSGARPKKIPPPPPPRKSSRLPGHVTPVSTEVSAEGSVSVVTPSRGDVAREPLRVEDSSIVVGHQMGIRESGVVCTSTPKSSVLPKPLSKFEKGIVEGITVPSVSNVQYSSPLDQGHSVDTRKDQSSVKESNREDRGSSSESSTSSGSLDSQKGTVILRCKNPPPKKPKPPPPERKSSLSHMPKNEDSK